MANKPTISRIKSRSEYQKIFKDGRRAYPNPWLIVNYRPNEMPESRFGWTVPKFVGTAVTRNKMKRWLREYLRTSEVSLKAPLDINFVFKRKTAQFYKELQHKDFEQAIKRAFKKVAG